MLSIDLKGKVAIVTGSTQGIGLGIAKMLARAGCDIAGCGMSKVDSSKVSAFQQTIEQEGQKAFYKQVDIKSESEINGFVSDVATHFGRIDFLLSNAGKNMFTSPEKCENDFWEENAQLNLKSHWLISKACYPELKKNKGFIMLMTSNHAYSTLKNCFPYNVTKAGIAGLVNSLTVEWGPDVRVVGLAPGFIETVGGEDWFNSFPDPKAKRREVYNIHPVKKIGSSEEVGAFCAFLCSDYADFMSGTTYLMDGGRSSVMQDI